jgi:hypothetical protein
MCKYEAVKIHTRIWHVRDHPKFTMWTGVLVNKIVCPPYIKEMTDGFSYMDMLQQFAITQMDGSQNTIFSQQDGAPSDFSHHTTRLSF